MNLKVLIFLFFLPVVVSGQLTDFNKTHREVEIGALLSTSGDTPFWLRTNQYGIVPLSAQFFSVRTRIGSSKVGILNKSLIPDTTSRPAEPIQLTLGDRRVIINYGLEAVVNAGKANQFLLPEIFISVKLKAIELYAGRRREITGLVDTTLTSGAYSWSGNALPMTKIQISTPQYVPILGKGLLSIKGGYAHGWFGEQFYTKGVLLHQKWLYGRVGKPTWKIKFYGGFNHQVQWGGRVNIKNLNSLYTVVDNKMPGTFRDYLNAVTGVSLNSENVPSPIVTGNLTEFDLTNRVGNHLGSVDLAGEVKFSKFSVLLYRQSVFDDGSLFFLNNISDGLSGISIKNIAMSGRVKIRHITFELLNTQSQGGNLGPDQTLSPLRGQDNYFNNGQFLDGWSYKDNTLGTPFITPTGSVLPTLPKYIADNLADQPVTIFSNNNRAKVFYCSFIGSINNTQFKFRASTSQNLGTYYFPFDRPVRQNSISISTLSKLPNKDLLLIFDVGIDSKGLYRGGAGTYIGLKKQW